MLTDNGGAFQDAGAAALARNFHQAKAGNLAHLKPGAVVNKRILEFLFNGTVVFRLIHINEVDNDQSRQIAQAHLTGGLFGGFEIGFQRRRFNIAFAC